MDIVVDSSLEQMVVLQRAQLFGNIISTVEVGVLRQLVVEIALYGQRFLVPLRGKLAAGLVVCQTGTVDPVDGSAAWELLSGVVRRFEVKFGHGSCGCDQSYDYCRNNN